MSLFRSLTLIFIVGFSFSAIATPVSELPKTRLHIAEDGVNLHGYFFPGVPNKPFSGVPLLLTHGLSSNLHEFEFLIPLLVAAGIDCYAFNFRGHGNGDEQSEVSHYTEGAYQLWHMAETDFPLMVSQVIAMGGRKPHVLGHSMGGMVPRASLVHGRVDESMIQSMVLLGSPPHLHGGGRVLRGLETFGINRIVEMVIFSGSGDDRITPLQDLESVTKALDRLNLINPFYWLAKRAATNLALSATQRQLGLPGDKSAILDWMKRATTQRLPKDILRSFASFKNDGYPYKDAPVPMPVLHIMGEADSLVSWQDIVQSAQAQSKESGHWLIRVKDTGHFGLVSPEVIDGYLASVLRFIRAPTRLGPKNRTFLEYSPGDAKMRSCKELLTAA